MIAEAAYTAGIIDGEGCISSHRSKRWYHVIIRVGQSDPSLVLWLQEQWGGRVSRRTLKTGKIFYTWTVSMAESKPVLEAIAPYSIVKKPQVIMALRMYGCRRQDEERQAKIHRNLQKLKRMRVAYS